MKFDDYFIFNKNMEIKLKLNKILSIKYFFQK